METHCSITEAATRLEVSRRTIDRFIARGDLASVKVGQGRRILVTSIDAMLAPPRVEARICTPEEVAELRAWWEQQLAEARAGILKTPKQAAIVIPAGDASARD